MSQDKNLRYEFDDFSFDVKTETLYYRGVPLPLTRKARQVFLILVQSANRTVEKNEIYNQIRTDSFVEEANLTQYIYLLRKCLSGNSGGENSYIETIPGQGYRFNASVSEVFVANQHLENAKRLAALGLELSITEMNVRLKLPASAADLRRQAEAYRDVAEFCLA